MSYWISLSCWLLPSTASLYAQFLTSAYMWSIDGLCSGKNILCFGCMQYHNFLYTGRLIFPDLYNLITYQKKKMWTRSCCEHITIPRSCAYFPGSSYMVFGGLCAPFNLNIDDQKLIYWEGTGFNMCDLARQTYCVHMLKHMFIVSACGSTSLGA